MAEASDAARRSVNVTGPKTALCRIHARSKAMLPHTVPRTHACSVYGRGSDILLINTHTTWTSPRCGICYKKHHVQGDVIGRRTQNEVSTLDLGTGYRSLAVSTSSSRSVQPRPQPTVSSAKVGAWGTAAVASIASSTASTVPNKWSIPVATASK